MYSILLNSYPDLPQSEIWVRDYYFLETRINRGIFIRKLYLSIKGCVGNKSAENVIPRENTVEN